MEKGEYDLQNLYEKFIDERQRERKRWKWGEREECAKEGWKKKQQVLIDCAS